MNKGLDEQLLLDQLLERQRKANLLKANEKLRNMESDLDVEILLCERLLLETGISCSNERELLYGNFHDSVGNEKLRKQKKYIPKGEKIILRINVDDLDHEKSKLIKEKEHLKEALEKINETYSDLIQQIEQLKDPPKLIKELKSKEKLLIKAKEIQKKEGSWQRIKELENEVKRLKKEVQETQNEVEELKEQLEQLKEQDQLDQEGNSIQDLMKENACLLNQLRVKQCKEMDLKTLMQQNDFILEEELNKGKQQNLNYYLRDKKTLLQSIDELKNHNMLMQEELAQTYWICINQIDLNNDLENKIWLMKRDLRVCDLEESNRLLKRQLWKLSRKREFQNMQTDLTKKLQKLKKQKMDLAGEDQKLEEQKNEELKKQVQQPKLKIKTQERVERHSNKQRSDQVQKQIRRLLIWPPILFWSSWFLNTFIKLGSLGGLLTLFFYPQFYSVLLLCLSIALIIEAFLGTASIIQEKQTKKILLFLMKLFIYIARLAIAALIFNFQFRVFVFPFPELMDIKILLLSLLLTYLVANITNISQIRETKKVPVKEVFETFGLLSSVIGILLSRTYFSPLISFVFLTFSPFLLLLKQVMDTCQRRHRQQLGNHKIYTYSIFINTNDINVLPVEKRKELSVSCS